MAREKKSPRGGDRQGMTPRETTQQGTPPQSMHAETRSQAPVERFHPHPQQGLSQEQVALRFRQGLNNGESGVKTKSEKQIILGNILTFFNILNFILALLVIAGGDYRNALFVVLVFWNIVIGSFQEIRSKRTIDKLSLISAPKATVVRNGQQVQVPVSDVVLDDVVLLSAGQQIAADAVVTGGEVEANESLITGESDPVAKTPGRHLLSGSFVISGTCSAQVEHVGEENYAMKITGSAKYVKPRNSEIMDGIDLIIKVIGFLLIPIGILLYNKNYFLLELNRQTSIAKAAQSMLGMIPEGLVLLSSVVFAVSVVRLAVNKTLVQDLYCVETLARVDMLCLDKTGTITEGTMQVDELMPFPGYEEKDMEAVMALLTGSLHDENPTSQAVADYVTPDRTRTATELIPFSSARKWSGVFFAGEGAYLMGACEFILGGDFDQIQHLVAPYAENGQRVLLLARSNDPFQGKELPRSIECIGLIAISDRIRREAPRTLRYFADQGVHLKVISGDNPITVSSIAKKAGMEHADRYIDASQLRTPEDIEAAVRDYTVFGRVTPQQKLAFVKALKADGHTVAMTGDGVNDVLALKEADCSIAMASGSDAARTVSSLVLLDSNFSAMPLVVKEGRRAINNLQRSAALFLSKTIFSAIIGVMFIFLSYAYPFVPIQMTLISSLTIGVPSFILALEPNYERQKGKFLHQVLQKSVPAGVTMALNILILCALSATFGLSNEQLSTLAVYATTLTGFMMLFRVCSPFNGLRGSLFCVLLMVFFVAVIFMSDFFMLTPLTIPMFLVLAVTALFSIAMMVVLTHFIEYVLILPQRKGKRKTKGGKWQKAEKVKP